MACHVMIDLETLSLRMNAHVLTLAAVKFDPRSAPGTVIAETAQFYRRINHESCRELGLDIDEKTRAWWAGQDEASRSEAFAPEGRVSIAHALDELDLFFQGATCVWSHGATFDVPILGELYRKLGRETPWKFWNARDTRTVLDLAGLKKLPATPNRHHALHDCLNQIDGVLTALRRLERGEISQDYVCEAAGFWHSCVMA